MDTILADIISYKRKEVRERQGKNPLTLVRQCIPYSTPVTSLRQKLLKENESGIIAEFKQKSPTLGVISSNVSVATVTSGYSNAGATALSVLTDNHFFGGSLNNFSVARQHNSCPMLQKDFFIDEYQIYEARALGADVILLIAAALTIEEVKKFASLAAALGMESILEIHTADELACLCPEVSIVGVNNRDLKTFVTDLSRAEELSSLIPSEYVKIAESGIRNPGDVIRLKKAGYNGFLIGGQFMTQADPVKACADFISQIPKNPYTHVH
ncbi:MAG: indole-3-glycerol phosphate synthase TrpC [Bacteroidota bacterium]|nr:indole-3-glycerol phosphate synthase TrpC [Bacteroidota bacterium]